MKKLIIAAALAISFWSMPVKAQEQSQWAISTNIPTWALLGTLNAGVFYALDCNWSLDLGVKYNPFTYSRGSVNQTQLKQLTPSLGVRYWFDGVYDGWFTGAKLLYSVYNIAGIGTTGAFEGELSGAALVTGYNIEMNDCLALSLGCGLAAARHHTTFYEAPLCGRITGHKKGWLFFPSDLMVSLFIKL